jgi:hypothetical protein
VGAARLHAAALAAIAADTRHAAAIADRSHRTDRELIAARNGASLAEALGSAPSFAVARHLWRLVADVGAVTRAGRRRCARRLRRCP